MVTDERHTPGAEFVVEVCRIGGMTETFLVWWVAGMTVSEKAEVARVEALAGIFGGEWVGTGGDGALVKPGA
jgi:hypothetical protein